MLLDNTNIIIAGTPKNKVKPNVSNKPYPRIAPIPYIFYNSPNPLALLKKNIVINKKNKTESPTICIFFNLFKSLLLNNSIEIVIKNCIYGEYVK